MSSTTPLSIMAHGLKMLESYKKEKDNMTIELKVSVIKFIYDITEQAYMLNDKMGMEKNADYVRDGSIEEFRVKMEKLYCLLESIKSAEENLRHLEAEL